MTEKVKTVSYGLGIIGINIANLILRKKGVEIVGAIDIDKSKVGKDLGEILEIGRQLGVIVTDNPSALLSKIEANIAIVATSSYVKSVYSQIMQCIKAGLNVVSTCEELAFPYLKNPKLSSEIDELAKKHDVTILSTGVNPGYRMDTFPLTLTAVCQDIQRIEIHMSNDIGKRRIPLQKKLGVGMDPEEFKHKLKEGIITAHVGHCESIALLAKALGWELDEIREMPYEPVVAKNEVKTAFTMVKPGQMLGYKGFSFGSKNGKKVIVYHGDAYIGAPDIMSYSIEGIPNLHVKIPTGIPGDIATAAIVVNSIPKVIDAEPGLKTIRDIPIPSAVLEDMRHFIKKN
ncbi:MAG: NADP-binding protein [Candidatus Bathyarchaeota archaeon]|nr:MAG: NADP-binding protein [Candidatus Bathyarchaeota archaeon]